MSQKGREDLFFNHFEKKIDKTSNYLCKKE